MEFLFSESSSSESIPYPSDDTEDEYSDISSNDELELEYLALMAGGGQDQERPRIIHYVEETVALYNEVEFKSHFRMGRDTFEYVMASIGPLIRRATTGRETIDPKKQLLLCLWIMATPDSYRSVCDRFDTGRATAIRSVRRVTAALMTLAPRIIRWPKDEVEETCLGFERVSGFPKTIGAIDGTHIYISAPKNDAASYVNRKGRHAIQLQAVCDHKRRFTHCYAGHAGSVHDQRVLRASEIHTFMDNPEEWFPVDTHLIGDKAYALTPQMMVPYKDNGHLTQRQANFNFCLSSARTIIERAFGLLKGRFRRLLDKLPMTRTDLIPHFVIACCVLHNICLMRQDDLPELFEADGDNRQADLDVHGPPHHLHGAGVEKRIRITDNLNFRHN